MVRIKLWPSDTGRSGLEVNSLLTVVCCSQVVTQIPRKYLFLSMVTPSALIIYPRNVTWNSHFSALIYKWYFQRQGNTSLTWVVRSSGLGEWISWACPWWGSGTCAACRIGHKEFPNIHSASDGVKGHFPFVTLSYPHKAVCTPEIQLGEYGGFEQLFHSGRHLRSQTWINYNIVK